MSYFNLPFLIYLLPSYLVCYYLLGAFKNLAVQNAFLLLVSIMFLAYLELLLLPLLVLLTLFNYWLGKRIHYCLWEGLSTKNYMRVCYLVNGGIFLVFQGLTAYTNSGGFLLGWEDTIFSRLVLPTGMGIFSLRAISYVADINNKKGAFEKNLGNLALYLCFFPQIVVGPLSSYQKFHPQMIDRKFDSDLFANGICRFVIGLAKKLLISGNLAVITNNIFALSAASDGYAKVPVSLAWLGILVFTLQIYYDFSAFTDMAIGMGNMFGFTAPENFNYPYMADSITDFWRRWMIPLRNWFDEYITKPLSKTRSANNDQLMVNSLIAFVFMGFWHKISVGILVWALLQVFCIAAESVITYEERKFSPAAKHIYVAIIILLSWSLFHSWSIYETLLFLRNLFGMNQNGFFSGLALTFIKEYWVSIFGAIIFIFPVAPMAQGKVDAIENKKAKRAFYALYFALMLSLSYLCLLYVARGLSVPQLYFSF